jgi:Ca2+-binding RTX toxin-like protein
VNGRGGADTFFLDDSGLLVNDRPISLNDVESVALNGKNGNDALIAPTIPPFDVTFNGAAGSDRIQAPEEANAWTVTGFRAGTLGDSILFTSVERLLGGGEADTLTGPNQNSVWRITGNNVGTVQGVRFIGFENLVGNNQNDVFVLANGRGMSGQIDGGAGRNTLNYFAYTTAVNVDLAAHTATNISGGIDNIRDVFGGARADVLIGDQFDNLLNGRAGNDTIDGADGNNILIGGGGNDDLAAGTGRDLLFGGNGKDTLTGGTGEDILFSGPTTFENKLTALDALGVLWSRENLDFATRIAMLRAGVVGVPKLNNRSARRDRIIDTLTGGENLDWHFGTLHGTVADTLVDWELGEETN